MHGTIGPHEVFARIARTGDALNGEYFYAKNGVPIPLKGTIDASGAVRLTEGAQDKSTGGFAGKCEGAAVRGTWAKTAGGDAGGGLPFVLEEVDARDAVLVATRKRTRTFAPKPRTTAKGDWAGFDFGKNEPCVDEASWPEVFGAATPEIERTINQALRHEEFVAGKLEEEPLRACVTGERAKFHRVVEVLHAADGIVSVRMRDMAEWEGGTHPWDPGEERWHTFDTRTGRALARADLIAPSAASNAQVKKLVARCAAIWLGEDAKSSGVADDEKLTLDNAQLLMAPTKRGLHIAATGYPPPARVLEGEGPTIAWPALAALGVLPKESPAARIWSLAPALGPKDSPCGGKFDKL